MGISFLGLGGSAPASAPVTDHSALSNLSFATAGHIGFAPSDDPALTGNITHTDTWNSGGSTFTGFLMTITNSASAAPSCAVKVALGGGNPIFKLFIDGTISLGNVTDSDHNSAHEGLGSALSISKAGGATYVHLRRAATSYQCGFRIMTGQTTTDGWIMYMPENNTDLSFLNLTTGQGEVIRLVAADSTVKFCKTTIVDSGSGSQVAVGFTTVSGPQTQAQYGWIPVTLSDDSKAWVPVWK